MCVVYDISMIFPGKDERQWTDSMGTAFQVSHGAFTCSCAKLRRPGATIVRRYIRNAVVKVSVHSMLFHVIICGSY